MFFYVMMNRWVIYLFVSLRFVVLLNNVISDETVSIRSIVFLRRRRVEGVR